MVDAATDTAKAGAAGQAAGLWPLWTQLKRLFPTWSLIPSSLYTPGAWGYVGVDFVSGFRQNPSTIRTFALLETVDDATFEALCALADLNARRQEQMFRAVVVGYLTIPVSVLAMVAELAGDSMMAIARTHTEVVIQLGIVLTLGPLGYAMSHWRSRQIVGVLDLIRIERGLSAVPAPDRAGRLSRTSRAAAPP
ncbi:MAG: hypothetical protein ACOH1H_12420 [Brevundimonas sp.]